MPENPSKSASSVQPDSITLARSVDPWAVASKRFRIEPDGSVTKVADYRLGWLFDFESRSVAGIGDLFATLRDVSADPSAFVLRGEPRDPNARAVLRRAKDRTGPDGSVEAATLDERPRSWLALDFDRVPAPPGRDARSLSFDEIAGIARGLLPEPFTDADLVTQLTSSHGLKPDALRFRVWCWLSRPLGRAELEAWLGGCPVDVAVFRATQPIYVAAPTFENAADPIGGRWELARSPFGDGSGAVVVPDVIDRPVKSVTAGAAGSLDSDPSAPTGRKVSAGVRGGWRRVLDTAGDGPGQGGFFGPITIGAAVFMAANGPDADPAEFLGEADRVLRERGAGRGEAYRLRRLDDARGWLAELQARERARTEPVPCAPPTGPVPVDLATAEAVVDAAVTTFFDAAEQHRRAVLRHAYGAAAIRAADQAGDRALADRIGGALGVAPVDPNDLDSALFGASGPRVPPVPPAPVQHGIRVTVGLGKTRATIEGALAFLTGPHEPALPVVKRRLAWFARDHRLAAEAADRIRAAGPGLSVVVWRGLSAADPAAPGETACRRAAEVNEVRRSGGTVLDVCGGPRRGLCPHHEVANAGQPGCGYRRQMAAAGQADIVVVAGNSVLADRPPKAVRRGTVSVDVVDPATGLAASGLGAVELDIGDFDAVVIDEPVVQQLVQGLDGPFAEIALNDLSDPVLFDDGLGATPGEEAGLRAAARELRPVLAALAVEARSVGGRGPLCYGAIRRVFSGADDDAIRRRAGDLARVALRAVVPLRFDPAGDWPAFVARRGPVVRSNRLALAVSRIMAAIEAGFRVRSGAPDGDALVFLRIGETDDGHGGAVLAVSARAVEDVDLAWRVPTVALDATLRPQILRRWWPALDVGADARVLPDPAVVRVRAVFDRGVSYAWLDDAIKGTGLGRLARFLELRLAEFRGQGAHGIDGLVVMPLKLETALRKHWHGTVPVGLELAHFGAIRGQDRWSGVRWLAVISRPLPPSAAIEDLAGLLDGVAVAPAQYDRRDAVWRMAPDGTGRRLAEAVPQHPDRLAEELRAAACDDEVLQAVGRGRAIRRTGSNRLDIDILTNQPVADLPVAELVRLDDMLKTADQGVVALVAARGVRLDPSMKGALAVLARLVGAPSAKAVAMDLVRARKATSRQQVPYKETIYKGPVAVSVHSPVATAPANPASGDQAGGPIDRSVGPLAGRPVTVVRLRAGRFAVPAEVEAADLDGARAVVRHALALAGATPDAVELLAPDRPARRRRSTRATQTSVVEGAPATDPVDMPAAPQEDRPVAEVTAASSPDERRIEITLSDMTPLGDRLGLARPTTRKVVDRLRLVERREGADAAVAQAIRDLIGEALRRGTASAETARAAVITLVS